MGAKTSTIHTKNANTQETVFQVAGFDGSGTCGSKSHTQLGVRELSVLSPGMMDHNLARLGHGLPWAQE